MLLSGWILIELIIFLKVKLDLDNLSPNKRCFIMESPKVKNKILINVFEDEYLNRLQE